MKHLILLFFFAAITNVFGQDKNNDSENWLQEHFEQRMYLGTYDSFGDEKATVVQAGYDAVLNLINISPTWNLVDFSLGLDFLLVRDQIEKDNIDNNGYLNSRENRLIPALELNWGARLYFLSLSKIKTSLYFDAAPITFVVYAKPYPNSGTNINIGTHLGFGIKSQVNDALNVFATVRFFSHTSNGKPEENNPALDMTGLVLGVQF
jgi:hypothetical protein